MARKKPNKPVCRYVRGIAMPIKVGESNDGGLLDDDRQFFSPLRVIDFTFDMILGHS